MSTAEVVREAVANALNVPAESLKPDTSLYSLPDFDSVQMLTLMVALDDVGVQVPQHKVGEIQTFGDILKLTES
ncbi:MAG: acyl carrier protein [Verrucomicrobia bacterium]|nr:acyl carrier protein [Verrucomicrobiota bacterium]